MIAVVTWRASVLGQEVTVGIEVGDAVDATDARRKSWHLLKRDYPIERAFPGQSWILKSIEFPGNRADPRSGGAS